MVSTKSIFLFSVLNIFLTCTSNTQIGLFAVVQTLTTAPQLPQFPRICQHTQSIFQVPGSRMPSSSMKIWLVTAVEVTAPPSSPLSEAVDLHLPLCLFLCLFCIRASYYGVTIVPVELWNLSPLLTHQLRDQHWHLFIASVSTVLSASPSTGDALSKSLIPQDFDSLCCNWRG